MERLETEQLLHIRTSLVGDIRDAAEDAFRKHIHAPSRITVKVTGDTGPKAITFPEHTGVNIFRPLLNQPELNANPEVGEIRVYNMCIDRDRHILIRRDGDGWSITNVGQTTVKLSWDGNAAPEDVTPGHTKKAIPNNTFQLRSHPYQFDFESEVPSNPAGGAVSDVRVGLAAPDATQEEVKVRYQFPDGIGFEISSPKDIAGEKNAQLTQMVTSFWESLAGKTGVGSGGGPVPVGDKGNASPGKPAEEMDCYKVEAKILGKDRTLTIRVQPEIYSHLTQKLWQVALPRQAERLGVRIGWQRVVSAGSVTISMAELKALERDSVIVLRKNSSTVLDPVFLERRLLERTSPGYGPGAKLQFKMGDIDTRKIKRPKLEGRGQMTDSRVNDGGAIPMLVEAILPAKRYTFDEMKALESGSPLELNVSEGGQVGIAINGEILGTGTIVTLPNGSLGVRVSAWYV